MFGLRANQVISAAFIATAVFTAVPQATAGVVVNGTRVVYPAAKREVTISIRNASETPSLVQAWLDAGDPQSKAGTSKSPLRPDARRCSGSIPPKFRACGWSTPVIRCPRIVSRCSG